MTGCEAELRKLGDLRKANSDYEEQNAMLSKHIDNMRTAIDKLEDEVRKSEEEKKKLQNNLIDIQQILSQSLSSICLPQASCSPNEDTIEEFVEELLKLFENPSLYEEIICQLKSALGEVQVPD